jgi:MFS family permease
MRNYRLFVTSQIVANTGLWMQRVAQDWLVLQLTGSAAAVGVTVALQFTPMLLFGLFGGVIADRYPKRSLLIGTQTTAAMLALSLATLTLTGSIHVWHVYGIAVLLGFVTVIDNPARQVFVNEMVGPEHLRNAISVNSSIFQLGGLVGPALSGVLIHAVGEGWSFGINAAACGFVVMTLVSMRTSELFRSPVAERAKGQLRDGLRYVTANRSIFWAVVLVGFVAVFGMNMPVLLSAFSKSIFHVGAGGYGLFNSLVALGALGGALASTRRKQIRLRTLVISAAAFGLLQATAGIAPTELTYCLALIAVGGATLAFLTGANSLVQMNAGINVRGRVMSLYMLVLLGGQAIGGLLMGRITETLGPRTAMVISGLVPAIATLGIALLLARASQLTLRVDWQHREAGKYLSLVPRHAQG